MLARWRGLTCGDYDAVLCGQVVSIGFGGRFRPQHVVSRPVVIQQVQVKAAEEDGQVVEEQGVVVDGHLTELSVQTHGAVVDVGSAHLHPHGAQLGLGVPHGGRGQPVGAFDHPPRGLHHLSGHVHHTLSDLGVGVSPRVHVAHHVGQVGLG